MKTWDMVFLKWKVVPFIDKVKLAAKIGLRLFGVRKNLYLGGYDLMQDENQRLEDYSVYEKLKGQNKISISGLQSCYRTKCDVEIKEKEIKKFASKVKENSYLALMTDHLDRGGLEEVVSLLAIKYTEYGIPVRVFCVYKGGAAAERLRHKNILVEEFHGKRKRFLKYVLKNRPCLVNTHYVIHFIDILNRLEIPVVEVIHNMYVFLSPDRIAAEKEKRRQISYYVAVSNCAKEIFQQKIGIEEQDKIGVIGNAGRYAKRSKKSPVQIRKELHIRKDAFVFLMAGSIDARKNQLGAVRAFSVLCRLTAQPAVLVIAGETADPEYQWKLEQIIQNRRLEDKVFLIGYYREMIDLMNASDAYLLDSYYEGWSMAAAEAAHCGLPILHSECGSGIELTAGGENGILIGSPISSIASISSDKLVNAMHAGMNENIEQTAAAMLSVLKNKEYWKQKKQDIQQSARKNYSVEKMAGQYLTVYAQAYFQKKRNRAERYDKSRNRNYKL